MQKKLLSLVLTATLAFTMLTGCGSDKDIEIAGDIEGAITISCYEAMTYQSFLEQAARSFEDQYPGTKIEIITGGSMPEIRTQQSEGRMMAMVQNIDNQQEKDDYVNKLNTEIMGGKGPDIIALDVVPYYKYADKKQLVDLSQYLASDAAFNSSDYAMNVFDATKYKGGQYLFPIDYTFDYIAYDTSLFPQFPNDVKMSLSEAIEATTAKALESGHKIFGLASYTGMSMRGSGADMFSALFLQDYDLYVDVANKKVNLDNGRFVELLENIRSYEEKGLINPANVMDIQGERELNLSALQQNRQERYYAKKNNSFSLINLYTRNLGNTTMGFVIGGTGMGDTSNDEFAGLLANERGDVLLSYAMGFGINSNSKNKATAWEFLKFLAGEEMQSSGLTAPGAIPVNKEARATLATMHITGEAMQKRMENMESGIGGGLRASINGENPPEIVVDTELSLPQENALANYLEDIERFTNQLNKFAIRDDKIDDMIYQEVRHFFTGEKSAAEVVSNVQSRANLYLNE